MKATDTLRQEHQAVKLMIQIMEAMSFRIRAGRSVQRQDLERSSSMVTSGPNSTAKPL
jgi:hemerythrin-like domain-containing protein